MFSGSPWSSATYRATLSVAFVGIAGALALIAAALVEERASRIEAATAQADNISRLVSSYVLQTIEKADMVTRDVKEHVTPADMRARRGANPERAAQLHRLLAHKLAAVPEGSVVHVTNAAGEHIYSSWSPLPVINIADRDHFRRQKENPSAGLVISPPIVSRTTGKWAIALTRRLDMEDGSFAGTITLVVNLEGIEKFFATVNVMDHGVVNMRDGGMRLMARYPAAQASVGTPVPDHPALPYIGRGLDHAIYQGRGSVDNVLRLYSYRRVDSFPMYVFVGLSDDDYLADWRLHLRFYGLSGLVLSLAVLFLVHFARRGAIGQAQAQAALAGAEEAASRLNAELEDRVAQRTAELEAANKELEEFSYSVSHDMRAPLRAIDGFSRILLEEHGEALGAEGRHQMAIAGRNARQMAQLIDGMLQFLRMRKHRMSMGRLDLAAKIRQAFEELSAGLPAGRRATLDMGELPPAWGDPEMLRVVVRHLIANAVKFASPERDLVVRVSGSAGAAANDYVVTDNGIGFDMAYVDKLFKVFERVHRTGEYEGAAIGLAIVKRIVDRHGGRVRAEGKVGEGASFRFSLPNPDPTHGAQP